MQKHRVIIIGSGFGGQAAAVYLQRQGIDDVLMLERRAWMGGTWSQNSYPGAAVDVQSPLYSLSFEPYPWTEMFAKQDELVNYTHHVFDKYGLRQKVRLNANVTQAQWDEGLQHWVLTLESGEVLHAQFLINASGPLSTPVIPKFKGQGSFEGASFHTNAWDAGFEWRGKRVAIIGSGASAAQVIPAIAPDVGHLHVFQRTPHWVLPRPDHVFSPLQRKLLSYRPVYKAVRSAIYWGLESRMIGFKYSKSLLNVVAQGAALKHLHRQVADPQLRQALTPDFTIGCKRIILSNSFYPALCRDNVSLHAKDDGLAEINAGGILTAKGHQVDVDAIVYATGYDATDGMISYPVVGQQGLSLQSAWSPYPRAYLGTMVPRFPNLFIMAGPNTIIGHTSLIFLLEAQMNYIVQAIGSTVKRQAASIQVTASAEDRYTRMIHEEMKRTVWQTGGCQSWYQSKSGHITTMFPGFSFNFWRLTKAFKPQDHAYI